MFLNIQEKDKFCLLIAKQAKEYITDKEARTLVESVLTKCWECLDIKCDISEELYDYLDNEVNGFTLFQEQETDKSIIEAWNCIIDAIAFICKSVYLNNGAKYFPEPIESVDDDTIDHMIHSFLLCSDCDLEINIRDEKILRLWNATGRSEMNEVYHIQRYLPDSIAIGDDEGGFAVIDVKKDKTGIYAVSFSDLDDKKKIFLAPSLTDFLFHSVGVDVFLAL